MIGSEGEYHCVVTLESRTIKNVALTMFLIHISPMAGKGNGYVHAHGLEYDKH